MEPKNFESQSTLINGPKLSTNRDPCWWSLSNFLTFEDFYHIPRCLEVNLESKWQMSNIYVVLGYPSKHLKIYTEQPSSIVSIFQSDLFIQLQ